MSELRRLIMNLISQILKNSGLWFIKFVISLALAYARVREGMIKRYSKSVKYQYDDVAFD